MLGNGSEKVCSNFLSQWCNIKVVSVVGGVLYSGPCELALSLRSMRK